jgi:hypothetical protein
MTKTNSAGNVQWNKKYSTSGWGFAGGLYCAKQTTDGGYILMSTNFGNISSNNQRDVYLIKTNTIGDTLWTKKYGKPGSMEEFLRGVEQTLDKGFITTGMTQDTLTGVIKKYLIKTDSLGFSGGCYEYTADITVTSFTVTETPVTITTQAAGLIYNPIAVNTFFDPIPITTLCDFSTSQVAIANKKYSFDVFPNPFSSYTTFETNKILINATLIIYNSFGQQVKQIKNISGRSIILERDNLPGGLYVIRLCENNKTISTKKIIITD